MILLVCLLLSADRPTAVTSGEAPPLRFGQVSDLVWTSGTALRFNATAPLVAGAVAMPAGAGSDFSGEAILSLAVDYFAMRNLSVGGFVRGSYAWSSSTYGPGFGVGPRIGYVLAFSDWASFWPRLDVSFGGQATFLRNVVVAPTGASGTMWYLNAQLNLPLVFSILNHVLLGVGPFFAFEPEWLAGNGNLAAFAFNFGLQTFLGLHY